MGVDFLKSKAKTFVKAWDNSRLEIARRGLFTREPDCVAKNVVAKSIGPLTLRAGDQVLLRADGDRLLVLVDLSVRAEFIKPPASVVEAIRKSGEYAKGNIATAFPTLGLIEVSIQ